MKTALILLISFYQGLVSPSLKFIWPGGNCLYNPTCSEYFKQAVIKYGTWKGSKLGFQRIARCNPSSIGGFDPLT